MRTSLHAPVSLLSGIFIFALTAFGMGAWFMIFYNAGAIASFWGAYKNFSRDLELLCLIMLLLPVVAGVAGCFLVFHRLRYNRWLPRRASESTIVNS
jgi:hypothetical protein